LIQTNHKEERKEAVPKAEEEEMIDTAAAEIIETETEEREEADQDHKAKDVKTAERDRSLDHPNHTQNLDQDQDPEKRERKEAAPNTQWRRICSLESQEVHHHKNQSQK